MIIETKQGKTYQYTEDNIINALLFAGGIQINYITYPGEKLIHVANFSCYEIKTITIEEEDTLRTGEFIFKGGYYEN